MTLPTSAELLSIPRNAGRAILERGGVVTCRLLNTDRFLKFCRDRSLSLTRERLARLEQLQLFRPIFRVRTPPSITLPLSIPMQGGLDWFERGWAWDTTEIDHVYDVPNLNDRTQEGYYSMFQIDHLELVLTSTTLTVEMDAFLNQPSPRKPPDWAAAGRRWTDLFRDLISDLKPHEYRPAVALLCQFISDRYYPQTNGDQRTINVPTRPRFYSDQWISVFSRNWDWHSYVRAWDPKVAVQLFQLTPEKLRHAYEGLAHSQAHCDPLERWYLLTQFIVPRERQRLKGDALRAETLRSGAHMLRLLYRELYGEDLAHPNEIGRSGGTPVPEVEVRKDTRRYLEFVANRFGVNPQPKLALIVEGMSEEVAVSVIFERYFGASLGTFGIELIVLGGVDAATGAKEDRFRAILRLIDYLHHHQTITFLILDNERYARRLKAAAKDQKSIHHRRRYVTRPEYIKIWKTSYEFENFSPTEIAAALTQLLGKKARFTGQEIEGCKSIGGTRVQSLEQLYEQRTGKKLIKPDLSHALVSAMLLPTRRSVRNRPIIRTLERVAQLAARNPLPTMQELWEKNQGSKYLGKRRR